MSRLIQELKNDHKVLVKILGEVKELGITSEEGRKRLMAAKAGLLAHLKKEDAELYPPLRLTAANDPRVQGLMNTFTTDMGMVAKQALAFFDKYGGDISEETQMNFARDFGTLVGILGARINKEENALYPEYDKVHPV